MEMIFCMTDRVLVGDVAAFEPVPAAAAGAAACSTLVKSGGSAIFEPRDGSCSCSSWDGRRDGDDEVRALVGAVEPIVDAFVVSLLVVVVVVIVAACTDT